LTTKKNKSSSNLFLENREEVKGQGREKIGGGGADAEIKKKRKRKGGRKKVP